jgi:hypothetical protein
MGLEALLTGHLLCDRYRVDRVIGRGGMGAVYRATDVRLERGIAVKVITAPAGDVSARDRLRSRFHREARAAARLQHPNVVTVHDFGTDPRLDLDFLVMELLRGEDLACRLHRVGPPDLATALDLLEQAARGVAAGHNVGLIHRDLKPGNLFLSDAGAGTRLCVLDFGIAQVSLDPADDATSTQLTVAGRVPHSPAYAAPEQLRGEAPLTAAADVWSLGATAFLLLTGERPFDETAQRRMMNGAALPAPSARARAPHVPEPVDDLVRIALSHRPADRFRDASAFARSIADARRGHAAPAPQVRTDAWTAPAPRTAADAAVPGFAERTHTRAERTHTRAEPHVAAAFDEGTLLDVRPPEGASYAPPPIVREATAEPRRLRRAGWARRAAAAGWSATLTLVSIAVAVAFGAAMFEAFFNNLTEPFYASVAGLTVSVPWAIHRLSGRRGSYPLALIACVVTAIALFRLLAPLTSPEVAMIVLGPAQILAAGGVARVTRRRAGADDVSYSSGIPA